MSSGGSSWAEGAPVVRGTISLVNRSDRQRNRDTEAAAEPAGTLANHPPAKRQNISDRAWRCLPRSPATSIATDLTEGLIDRFLSLPTSGTAYVLGHVLAETAGLVVALTVLSLTGLVIGWRTHTSVAEIVAAYALLLMFGNAIVWLGTYIGLTVRSADAVTGVVFVVVFPLTFLSNAFVPIGTLPTVLEYTAAYNPVSVLVAAVRELFGNPTAPVSHSVWPLEHPVVAALGRCLLLLAAAIPLTLHRFRQRTTN